MNTTKTIIRVAALNANCVLGDSVRLRVKLENLDPDLWFVLLTFSWQCDRPGEFKPTHRLEIVAVESLTEYFDFKPEEIGLHRLKLRASVADDVLAETVLDITVTGAN